MENVSESEGLAESVEDVRPVPLDSKMEMMLAPMPTQVGERTHAAAFWELLSVAYFGYWRADSRENEVIKS